MLTRRVVLYCVQSSGVVTDVGPEAVAELVQKLGGEMFDFRRITLFGKTPVTAQNDYMF